MKRHYLNKLLDHLKTNAKQFAESLEFDRTDRIYNVLKFKNGISSKLAGEIISKYPNVSYDWLITGEGEMLKDEPKHEAIPIEDFNFMLIPHIPVTARAGYLCGYGDEEYINSLPTVPVIVDKQYKGKYRVFDVDGDSMYDGSIHSICDNDKILCREVMRNLWRYKLHFNDQYFVIVHKEEGVIIKQIIDHNVETCEITCHSLNPLFSDFTLNLNDVIELYNVIKIVDRNARF